MEVAQTERSAGAGEKSQAISKAAAALIPARAPLEDDLWAASGMTPPVMAKGKGAVLTDVDGNEYIDYDCAYGSLILGHADERVVVAVNKAISKGRAAYALSETKVRLAELIVSRYATIDMVQFINSTADAVRSAAHLARAHTGRERIIQFDGCGYIVRDALLAPYNNTQAVKNLLQEHHHSIAALMVQPVVTSFGLVLHLDGFLQSLRDLCDANGTLLILDESVAGFRANVGQETDIAGVAGDLTILGSVIGGCLPLAAYGGRKDIMAKAAPSPGDLGRPSKEPASVNTVSMAAGLATLQAIGESGFYDDLEAKSARLEDGLRSAAAAASVDARHTRMGGILGTFFTDQGVVDLRSARACDMALSARYFHAMLSQGIFLPPSPWPLMFVSAAHTDEQIDRTVDAAHNALNSAAAADSTEESVPASG